MQSERYEQVKAVLLKRGFGALFGLTSTQETLQLSPPERLRLVIEELGGGFVLLGQLLRYRIDLVPATYCKALVKLRDKGTPLTSDAFATAVAQQYSRPIQTMFAEIKKQPFAVDVISQTHEAITPQQKKLLVKVIKPNVHAGIKEDIAIMKYFAKKLQAPIDTTYIIKELETYVKNKLDLRLEETFLVNSGKYASSYYPEVNKALSNKRVLVLSYVKKKPVEHLGKQIHYLQQDLHFIQGEFILTFIGFLLFTIGIFLPSPLSKIFIISSIVFFSIVFIFLVQRPK